MRVAIYCRVSRSDQDAGKQETLCREYCQREGHEVYQVYRDDAVSGAKTSRPAFDEFLTDMRAFHFQGLVVTRLDRVGRSLQHILALFEEFKSKQVHFIAVTQNIDTSTAVGKLQLQMLGAFILHQGQRDSRV